MDIQSTITRVKGEYKDYLRQTHPDWADSTVSTHVSDAFYLYQNTIALSFWKCFADDGSMAAAQQDLLDYFTNEVISDRARERAKGYYKDLTMLKEFIDSKGGVRQYIGYEYDCEVTIYQYAKRVYDGEVDVKDAVKKLCAKVPCFGEGSHKFTVGTLFSAMMNGKVYTWKANTELTSYFIAHIGEDYGRDKLVNALQATLENIKYYYGQTGNKSTSIRRSCRRIAEQYGISISFGDDIFDGIIPKDSSDAVLAVDTAAIRYWLYAAGDGSANWESDYAEGIMAIGWPGMGDLSAYGSKEEMRAKMRELYGGTGSYRNQVLATWQFANEIKPGDVVFVKKGLKKVVGRGIVEGEYAYDKQRGEFCHTHKVRWTDKGEWEHPDQYVMKTLTDMTPYTDFLKKMQALFDEGKPEESLDSGEETTAYDPYTAEDFLQDVYMDAERYQTLKALVLTKKNVILQGAPGVGKTFAAKRLAYSIMGEKDASRVQMVQFHQSYSYEDFIMGFRPTETGFALKKGVFYEFCRKAEKDDERPYFFIIDEINRGNLSKIFGELFMLIESDKRGVELQLLYADEQFSIPGNVHIIGMMNTADRSLAMLDYALRRRFAFFEMPPAFTSSGFQAYKARINNIKFDRLIETVERLNKEITEDDSLGEGFRIGHSYFCTNLNISDEWLRSVVEFELIPLLKEYWFDEPAKIKDWSHALWEAVK